MEHILFMQKAKLDKKGEYIKAHKECWPELLQAIKESGIEREIIWMHEDDILIYMMTENSEQSMKRLGEKEVFKRWLKKMDPLLAQMQDYDSGVVKLEKVFDLENQLERI